MTLPAKFTIFTIVKTFYYILAQFVSIAFHPIVVFPLFLGYILTINPYALGTDQKVLTIINLLFFTVLFPSIAVVIMKLSGMISNVNMRDQKERIGPYIVSIVFCVWMFLNVRNQPFIADEVKICALGLCFSLGLGFFVNLFLKVSLHTMSWGNLMAILIIGWRFFDHDVFEWTIGGSIYSVHVLVLSLATLLIGAMVAVSRLYLKAHRLQEVYGGFLIGFVSQFLALRFLL